MSDNTQEPENNTDEFVATPTEEVVAEQTAEAVESNEELVEAASGSDEITASEEAPADDAGTAPAEETEAPAEDTVDEEPADASGEESEESEESDVEDAAEEFDPAEEFKADLAAQPGDWYVIHSYAGYENRVKANLENRIISLDMEDYIFEIQVPMEEVVEIKNGQRKKVRRVRVPSYVLVRMDLTDESWGVVRHTPGVTGFVGNAYDPVPLTTNEIFSMLAPMFEEQQAQAADDSAAAAKAASPTFEVEFEVGESVLVKEGSFEGHPATIQEIKPETQKLTVLLSIFERDVPVELSFNQVQKL